MLHNLKIHSEYYQHILECKKTFEIRLNDCDYQVGDTIFLNEINRENGYSKLHSSQYLITYIHSGLGMADGYVAMSIVPYVTTKDAHE